MKRNTYTLTDNIAFTANTPVSVDLPRSGYITHISCLLRLDITAAAGATSNEDAMARVIKAAKITAAGGKNYFDIKDGRVWKYWNYFRYLGQIRDESVPTSGSNNIVRAHFPIHLGFDPFNLYDAKVVIPARDIQNPKMEITWGSSSDIGDNQTINDGEMTLTISEIVLEEGERVEDIFTQGIVTPRFEHRTKSITTTYSDLGLEDEVPVGDTLYMSTIMMLNSAGNRTDSDMTEVGIKFPRRRETPYKVSWQERKASSRLLFSTAADITGASLIPWEFVSLSPFGIDLTLAQIGDVKLGFTIGTSGGVLHILHYALG